MMTHLLIGMIHKKNGMIQWVQIFIVDKYLYYVIYT